MKKKRILFIHHTSSWGGSINSLIKLINELDFLKYEVEVLLLRPSMIGDKLAENGIKFSIAESLFYRKYYRFFTHSEAGYIKWFHLFSFIRLSLFWILSRYYFAERELKKHNYDIVHLNSSVLTDWLAPAKKNGKVIIHIREPFRKGRFDILHSFFLRQMRIYADKVIAISNDNAKRINLINSMTVICNFVERPVYIPKDESYKSKSFIYLGGSSPIKGFYTMVNSLNYLEEGVSIVFGGNYTVLNENKNIFKQSIKWFIRYDIKQKRALKTIQAHPRTEIIGLTKDVDMLISEACGLVSPFLVPHFSRPVIEAHMHKKPAIGSDVIGMEEIIEHRKTGLLFEQNNAKKLASAINFIAYNPDKGREWGENGYEIAKNKFSPSNIIQLENIYDQL